MKYTSENEITRKNTSEKYGIRIGSLWNELQEHKKGQTKNNKKG